MKKVYSLFALLAILGLASCQSVGTSSAGSSSSTTSSSQESSTVVSSSSESSEEAESSITSDSSSSGDVSSSEANSSSAEEEKNGGYHIEYQALTNPEGTTISEYEFFDVVGEAAANAANVSHATRSVVYEEIENPFLTSESYGSYRDYTKESTINEWIIHSNDVVVNNITEENYSSTLGGYTEQVLETDTYYINGDEDNGYYIYSNYAHDDSGLIETGSVQYYSANSYDEASQMLYEYVVDYNLYDSTGLRPFSTATYDTSHVSYVKAANGDIYTTNAYIYTASVSMGDATITRYNESGFQLVYSLTDDGYKLTSYISMSIQWYATDASGNVLEEPVVTFKRLTTGTFGFDEKTAYAEELTPIVRDDVSYTAKFESYVDYGDGATLFYDMDCTDVTAYYRGIKSGFDGYAFMYNTDYDDGNCLIAVTSAEGETVRYGYSDFTSISDCYGYYISSGEDFSLENTFVISTERYYRIVLLLNKDLTVYSFTITTLF